MNASQAASRRVPHVVAVGLHRLKDMLYSLAPSYAGRANVSVLDRGFQDAVTEVRAMARDQGVDVLVAAGSNGEYLRQQLDLPVILVRVGGYDIMRALGRARDISQRIALVTHGSVSAEVELFNNLFALGIEQRSYRTDQEARDCVRELRAKGVEVIVAPGLVTDLAEEAGLHGVFLYSQDAVREALDDAVEVARVARIEAARRERLNAIIGQLREGVVAVDMQERIEILNPAMEKVLGQPAVQLFGRRLSEVSAELSLADTLQNAAAETDELRRVDGRTLVTSRMPIHEQGVQTGAVLSCRDSAAIERVDRDLRARRSRAAIARYQLTDLVGDCAAIRRTRQLATQFAGSDATVLIVGESGTGKELLAQGIHRASHRSAQPFIAVNCAAFPEQLLESELFGYEEGAFTGARRGGKIGLFEAAHTGTLFLDEVGEMPVPLQTRLLRVLQEKEILRIGATEPIQVNVRVIAATHRNLAELIDSRAFRRDLYYRLNILRVELPSLRERRDDLPMLAAHILKRVCARLHVTVGPFEPMIEELVQASARYDWPGNVRELENLIERIASRRPNDRGTLRELIPEIFGTASPESEQMPLAARKEEAELELIRRVLDECGGNRNLACTRLGIGRTTLWRKLAQDKSAG